MIKYFNIKYCKQHTIKSFVSVVFCCLQYITLRVNYYYKDIPYGTLVLPFSPF